MMLIRYEAHKGYNDEPFRVERYEYFITRETQCCYVINWGGKDKFILKDGRKRYAYPTDELAKKSFEARQQKRYWFRKMEYDMMCAVKESIEKGTVYEKQPPKYDVFEGFPDENL